MVTVTPPPFTGGLSRLANVHFPSWWLGVYIKLARSPTKSTFNVFGSGAMSITSWGSQALTNTGPTSFTFPTGTPTWDNIVASQMFLNTGLANDNIQGTRIFKVQTGKKYTGSITATDIIPADCPNGIVVTATLALFRLIPKQKISFTQAGTTFSFTVVKQVAALSYTFGTGLGPFTRTDPFSFTV